MATVLDTLRGSLDAVLGTSAAAGSRLTKRLLDIFRACRGDGRPISKLRQLMNGLERAAKMVTLRVQLTLHVNCDYPAHLLLVLNGSVEQGHVALAESLTTIRQVPSLLLFLVCVLSLHVLPAISSAFIYNTLILFDDATVWIVAM